MTRRLAQVPTGLPAISLALAVAAAIAVTGPAGSARAQSDPVPRIQRTQPGDNKLTCDQIKTQLAEIEQITAEAEAKSVAAQDNVSKSTAASVAGLTVLSFLPIPGLGALGGAASHQQLRSQEDEGLKADQRVEDARARRDVLVTLGNARNCW